MRVVKIQNSKFFAFSQTHFDIIKITCIKFFRYSNISFALVTYCACSYNQFILHTCVLSLQFRSTNFTHIAYFGYNNAQLNFAHFAFCAYNYTQLAFAYGGNHNCLTL